MLARKKSNIAYRATELLDPLPSWVDTARVLRAEDGWSIETLEGVECARDGDWLVEGEDGGYYPKSATVFSQDMEDVGDGYFIQRSAPMECWPYCFEDSSRFPLWLRRAVECGMVESNSVGSMTVHTSWGDQLATVGNDIIMHRSDTDIYVCKRSVFEKSYCVLES